MSTEFNRRQQLEWEAQERALREERACNDVIADSRIAQYRMIARALRQPMPDFLPVDFAKDLAARVDHAPLDTRLERWLMWLLAGAMMVSGIVAMLMYGAGWWQAVVSSLPDTSATTINWLCAAGACMGGSWLLQRMGLMATQDGAART